VEARRVVARIPLERLGSPGSVGFRALVQWEDQSDRLNQARRPDVAEDRVPNNQGRWVRLAVLLGP